MSLMIQRSYRYVRTNRSKSVTMSVSQDARNVVLHPIALQLTEIVQSIDDLPFLCPLFTPLINTERTLFSEIISSESYTLIRIYQCLNSRGSPNSF